MNDYTSITDALGCPNCKGKGTTGATAQPMNETLWEPRLAVPEMKHIYRCRVCGGSGLAPVIDVVTLSGGRLLVEFVIDP